MYQHQCDPLSICRLCFISDTPTGLKNICEIPSDVRDILGLESYDTDETSPQTVCSSCHIEIDALTILRKRARFAQAVWDQHRQNRSSCSSSRTRTCVEDNSDLFLNCHVCGLGLQFTHLVAHISTKHHDHIADCELYQVLVSLGDGPSSGPVDTELTTTSCEDEAWDEVPEEDDDQTLDSSIKQEDLDSDESEPDPCRAEGSESRVDRKRFQCDLCEKLYVKMDSLRSHKRGAHNIGKLTCLTCYQSFTSREELNSHIQRVHRAKGQDEPGVSGVGNHEVSACPDCHKVFPLRELREHQRHVHAKRFRCPLCNEPFSKKAERDHHMLSHGKQCPVCQSEFPTMKGLRLHVKVHEKGHDMRSCVKEEIKAEDGLDNVVAVDKNSFPCPHKNCGVSLRSQKRLKVHLDNNHAADGYPCAKCDKVLETKKKYLAHQYQHNMKLCGICGVKISRSVAEHMRRHERVNQFKCKVAGCSKEFPRNCDLQNHIMMHTGEKPFSCNICGKKFSRNNKVIVHMRTHTGEKPYKCSFPGCSQAFAQPFDRTLHLRRHTGEKPYECGACGERFFVSYQMKKHNCEVVKVGAT